MTTREAIKRTDQNFAAWADWMDVAFARALKSGSTHVHAADPEALSAIEGAQIPGWGGYDYSRLAHSLDVMELYGDNVEMLRSFNPDAVMLTTSFGRGAAEAHRLWRELLRGTRGLILWNPATSSSAKTAAPATGATRPLPIFHEIRDGLGALLINSRRHTDPIGIVYSPASMRIQRLLDHKSEGEAWSRRNASSEEEDNPIRISVRNYARAIEHMGLQHRFVSDAQLEKGELGRAGYRVLILPRTIALSARAAEAIRDFVGQGGAVIADGEPGIFDEHGRRLVTPALAEISPARRPAQRCDLPSARARRSISPPPVPGTAIGAKALAISSRRSGSNLWSR